jgi:hypothetical protein
MRVEASDRKSDQWFMGSMNIATLEAQLLFHSIFWLRKRSYGQPLESGLNTNVCFYIEGLRGNMMVWFLMRWLLRVYNIKAAKTLTEIFGSILINVVIRILWT